ncbi:B-4DMT family transporter [Mycolicibacterium rufum]|uniref:B-4DMT family transporter n=1 Tax=Mycolicibacterium rufum TaxID=318424 RepID=A0A9X2YCX6_9MYCO|nr:B-4DMT family transporter [Mycolicibacterium rufum]KGI68045.1 membrane protein [Mycolicibacterium rufum]MCV7071015.1 B-4DMT family transporter [Mycolicibacterium rufum]ULP39052.1 B-4DMT family transporter [Mycolicibacterium rufum]
MSKWLLRGLVFAALMVIVRLFQGALINAFETKAGLISITLVALYAIVVLIWGYADGRSDARANPDPDRRSDLAMTWLLAGLFAGVVSGFVAWLIGLFYKNLYVEGLINEVTTFAAFTALLVFVFAIVGVGLGRWLVDRKTPDQPRRREGDDDRADTDVFAAVRDDRDGRDDVRDYDSAATDQHTSPVAVAEHDDETRRTDRRE